MQPEKMQNKGCFGEELSIDFVKESRNIGSKQRNSWWFSTNFPAKHRNIPFFEGNWIAGFRVRLMDINSNFFARSLWIMVWTLPKKEEELLTLFFADRVLDWISKTPPVTAEIHRLSFQEISNGRTHWPDPEKTWVSNSSIATYST